MKYQIISTIKDFPIRTLCKIAKVSKSGYYKWWKNADRIKDQPDALLIAEIFFKHKKKAGFRTIKMKLLQEYGLVMNHKKIIRIMKKYDMQTKIRKANPYKAAAKIRQENMVCENVLNRQFKQKNPYEACSIDITYLKYSGSTAFLSTLLDVKTTEVLAYSLSTTLRMDFIFETVLAGIENTPAKYRKTPIYHSDRGIHFTNNDYRYLLKENGIIQSMSAVGTPLDNAPIESFFGHLKDEIDYKECKTFEELGEKVDEYMYYYNNERKQWSKKKMTPIEYREYLLAS